MNYRIGSGLLYLSNPYSTLEAARIGARRGSKSYNGDINIYECNGDRAARMVMAYRGGKMTWKE